MDKLASLRIPLLQDAECRKLAIDRPKNMDARAAEGRTRPRCAILARMAVHQAYRSVLRHFEIMEEEGYPQDDFQKDVARHGTGPG
jgi:hypothetical protein